MPRRNLTSQDRENRSRQNFWWVEGAVMPWPATAGLQPMAMASATFIAVPPIALTQPAGAPSPTTPFISTPPTPLQMAAQLQRASAGELFPNMGEPDALQLYRADPFWYMFDAAAQTMAGPSGQPGSAYLPGGILITIPLNPGVATISFLSTTNTSPLYVNWLWGT